MGEIVDFMVRGRWEQGRNRNCQEAPQGLSQDFNNACPKQQTGWVLAKSLPNKGVSQDSKMPV